MSNGVGDYGNIAHRTQQGPLFVPDPPPVPSPPVPPPSVPGSPPVPPPPPPPVPQTPPPSVQAKTIGRDLDILLAKASELANRNISLKAISASAKTAGIDSFSIKALQPLAETANQKMRALDRFTGRSHGQGRGQGRQDALELGRDQHGGLGRQEGH